MTYIELGAKWRTSSVSLYCILMWLEQRENRGARRRKGEKDKVRERERGKGRNWEMFYSTEARPQ